LVPEPTALSPAGVLPPAACALGGASRAAPCESGFRSALGGASRVAPCTPGVLRVPEPTALSPAGVLPPTACALGGASRAALCESGFRSALGGASRAAPCTPGVL